MLIFLPGWDDITKLHDILQQMTKQVRRLEPCHTVRDEIRKAANIESCEFNTHQCLNSASSI
jgi:hypothetical protein